TSSPVRTPALNFILDVFFVLKYGYKYNPNHSIQ
ncbi:MAG: hypothetical protein ACI9GZ_004184, partial [Bacteroidia bacterium]